MNKISSKYLTDHLRCLDLWTLTDLYRTAFTLFIVATLKLCFALFSILAHLQLHDPHFPRPKIENENDDEDDWEGTYIAKHLLLSGDAKVLRLVAQAANPAL